MEDFTPSRQEQLTEKNLNRGFWWVNNKVKVRKAFTAVLGIVAFSLCGYGGYGFADWLWISGPVERANLAQMGTDYIPYQAINDAQKPQDLDRGEPVVLSAGAGVYDITSRIGNPNARHWVEFDYRFLTSGDPALAPKYTHAFLLPQEQNHFGALGLKSESAPSASLDLANVAWHRLDWHVVRPDYPTWKLERLNLDISDIAFTPASPADPLRISRASFVVTDNSAYSYRSVRFAVVLTGGSGTLGVNEVTVGALRSGEKRIVESTWLSDLPPVTAVEVIPAINIFDPSVFLGPGE